MKKVGIVLCSLLMLACTTSSVKGEEPSEDLYHFRIKQEDRYLEPDGDVITLQKKPFQIEMDVYDDRGIFLNFSSNDYLYRVVVGQGDVQEVLEFGGRAMAEYGENREKKIHLTDRGWHYWFVKEDGQARFDKVIDQGDYKTCIRTVDIINDIEEDRIKEWDELSRVFCVICDVDNPSRFEYSIRASQGWILSFE
ncbi:MAG: hypothetical protein PQJ60_08075 [Spirochaetales bacterium]|nr:hypothetical protein [Spirochaetales bacterium]